MNEIEGSKAQMLLGFLTHELAHEATKADRLLGGPGALEESLLMHVIHVVCSFAAAQLAPWPAAPDTSVQGTAAGGCQPSLSLIHSLPYRTPATAAPATPQRCLA